MVGSQFWRVPSGCLGSDHTFVRSLQFDIDNFQRRHKLETLTLLNHTRKEHSHLFPDRGNDSQHIPKNFLIEYVTFGIEIYF